MILGQNNCKVCTVWQIVYCLWMVSEVAIAATDLAEVIGSAVAMHLLFRIPIWAGVIITAADVLFIIIFGIRSFRLLEILIMCLIGVSSPATSKLALSLIHFPMPPLTNVNNNIFSKEIGGNKILSSRVCCRVWSDSAWSSFVPEKLSDCQGTWLCRSSQDALHMNSVQPSQIGLMLRQVLSLGQRF